jgi:uncharacterized protein
MQSSMFNLRVPIAGRDDVFLMNTLTDAQLVVSSDVAALLDQELDRDGLWIVGPDKREAIDVLTENGFLVPSRDHDREALDRRLARVKSDATELHITILTTLQCNFACDYCFQGDHGDYNKFADKMSLETAQNVALWIERELNRVRPEQLTLMFFGGEPLLNLPVMYYLAERLHRSARELGVEQRISIITNGLLLTTDIVDRLLPFGLRGVKITLDGDRDTHNRMRPLRGGQGTFDRIVENLKAVSTRVGIAIGGNFDEQSADSYPALLDFLREQAFGDNLVKVNFKPIVRAPETKPAVKGMLPLVAVGADGAPLKPLNGTCMTSAGAGGGTGCDSCSSLDDKWITLREETKRHGFNTPDGVPKGPCHVHLQHAHTVGPDGSLYACPGSTGDKSLSTGHIDDRSEPWRETARERFLKLSPWKECGDCAFIPTCAGGCVVASHTTLGDLNLPTCHKRSFESAVLALAHTVANAA